MGTVLASTILDRAQSQLLDKVGGAYSRTELLGWLNDGQKQIGSMVPSAVSVVANFTCAEGTRQTLPTTAWMLLDVYRNMGSGTTPGRALRVASKKMMDSFNPDWHSDDPEGEVDHFIYDSQDATSFWVYPPSDGTTILQVNYARVPPTLAETEVSTLEDNYMMSLMNYVMYRACEKQRGGTGGPSPLAAQYWDAFVASVSTRTKSEVDASPHPSLLPQPTPADGGDS